MSTGERYQEYCRLMAQVQALELVRGQLLDELHVCKQALGVAAVMLSGETGRPVEEIEGRIRDRLRSAMEESEREGGETQCQE